MIGGEHRSQYLHCFLDLSASLKITSRVLFSDDFVENYFQWSELEDDGSDITDTTKKPEANNPEYLAESEGDKSGQDQPTIPKVKMQEPGNARPNKESKFVDDMKQSRVESGISTETDASLTDSVKSNMDGKESLPNLSSSNEEDVEYHIKHSEYTILPYHTIPYHTILYHTIPYHTTSHYAKRSPFLFKHFQILLRNSFVLFILASNFEEFAKLSSLMEKKSMFLSQCNIYD